MANEVQIEITLEEKQALQALTTLTKNVKTFGDKSEKEIKKVDSAFAVFAGNVAANVASFAFNKVVDGFKLVGSSIGSITTLASEQESAVNRLNNQLALTGDFSEEASAQMQKFASELQATTRFGDEVVLNQLALAKSFGATNEQAKEVVKAAADMSASLGIDLESATRNVAKTLGGYAGELGETIPALKGLTQAQLQAGDGVALLAARFGGAAQGELATFSVAVQQLQNTLGDTGESFGAFITENDAVKAAITGIGKALVEVQKFLNDNKAAVNDFITNGILKLIDGFGAAAQAIVTFNNVAVGISNFRDKIVVLMLDATVALTEFGISTLETASKIGEFFGQSTTSIDSFTNSLQTSLEVAQNAIAVTNEQTEERIANAETFANTFTEISERVQGVVKKEVDTAIKAENKKTENSIKNLKKLSDATKKDNAKRAKIDSERTAYEKATQSERNANLASSLSEIATLTASNDKKLFAIGKAGALAQAIIKGQQAIQNALAAAPPPINFALAAAVGAAQAVQISKIASSKPPSFQNGGIVPGQFVPGGADNQLAQVSSGELILNRQQQQNLFNQLNNPVAAPVVSSENSRPIVIEIEGREIARVVRNEVEQGFAI